MTTTTPGAADEHREGWLDAAVAVQRHAGVPGYGGIRLWRSLAQHLRRLTAATTVTVAFRDEHDPALLHVRAAAGTDALVLPGWTYPAAGSVAGSVLSPAGGPLPGHDEQLCPHSAEPDVRPGPALALPLVGRSTGAGAVVMSRRRGQPPFTPTEFRLGSELVRQAGMALELSETQASQRSMEAQRQHVVDVLRDSVLQRLFSIGLDLQRTLPAVAGDDEERLRRAVDDLGETIREVRAALAP